MTVDIYIAGRSEYRVPVDHHMTVDIYIAGRSEYRVRVNRIPTAEADVAFAVARNVFAELLSTPANPTHCAWNWST